MRLVLLGCAVGAGLLLGLLPAGGAEEPPPPTPEELTASIDNLKQIVLAMHECAVVNDGALPNNVYAADGKPLLSWRVVLLPFLKNPPKLDPAFKYNEPWDSDHNKKLISKMPKVYAPVRVKAKPGETFYQVFVGPNAPFGPDRGAGVKFAAFLDGFSNTGLVYEAAEPVIWTKPDDLPYDSKKPLPKLGGMFDGEWHVGMGDGSVLRMMKDPDEKELRKLIVPDDGLPIDLNKLLAK